MSFQHTHGPFPYTRMRRLRANAFARDLVRGEVGGDAPVHHDEDAVAELGGEAQVLLDEQHRLPLADEAPEHLGEMVDDGYFGLEDACIVARKLMRDNAWDFYRLGERWRGRK